MTGQAGPGAFTAQDTLKAKCIAVFLLVFHHMFLSADSAANLLRLHFVSVDTLGAIAKNARYCVWIYVFLSAYGMTASYMKHADAFGNRRSRYCLHRVLMLQKFYLPFLLIEYILLAIANPASELLTRPSCIAANLLGVADILDMPKISGLYWYISFSLLLTLFFPLLYDLCERYGFLTIPMTSVLLLGYMGKGIHSNNGGPYLQYISAVFAGIIFAQKGLWSKCTGGNQSRVQSIARLAVLLACAIVLPWVRNSGLKDVLQYKQLLMTGAAVATCWIAMDYCTPRWLSRPMVFIGRHSGNIYLIHVIVLKYMRNIVYLSKNLVLSCLSCIAICVVLSMALNFLLEHSGYNRLFMKLDRRITGVARG